MTVIGLYYVLVASLERMAVDELHGNGEGKGEGEGDCMRVETQN